MGSSRPLRILALLIVVATCATACNREDNSVPPVEQQDRVISAVYSTDDPAIYQVSWFPAPCETFDEVLVEVDDDYANLTVRVSVDVDSCPATPIAETTVDLGQPLGEREIWDRAFGNTVALDQEPQ